jgi:hypothetical protein
MNARELIEVIRQALAGNEAIDPHPGHVEVEEDKAWMDVNTEGISFRVVVEDKGPTDL